MLSTYRLAVVQACWRGTLLNEAMYHADTKVLVCNCGQILLNLNVRKEKVYFLISELIKH